MTNKAIALLGVGNYSRSAPVTAQERVNLYAEVQTSGERGGRLVLYPAPGLTGKTNYGAEPNRGAFSVGDFKYYVNRDQFWRESNDGTLLSVGTLLTSGGLVDISDNGTQLCIVDGTYGYIYNYNTNTFTRIVAAGFPASPTSVTFLNLRFVITILGDGKYYWSSVLNGLLWDALDFATEESNPDNLIRCIADNGQIVLFGEYSTGFAGATGSDDTAFGRIGAAAIEFGLAAKNSLDKFDQSVMFLSRNRLGGVQVLALSGYSTQVVSTPDIETLFSSYAGVENATGFSFKSNGHSFYQINFPSANVSWRYNAGVGWDKVESSGGRHRANLQINHQNQSFVSDYETGQTYKLDENALTDNGATIVRQFIGKHQMAGNETTLAEFWLDVETGIGTDSGQGINPQIMMQISKDGGQTYGTEQWVSMGAKGSYRARAVWRRLGRSSRAGLWTFKFRITDPVKAVVMGAWGRFG